MKLTKLLALVLALAMVFSFAACSKAPAETPTTKAPATDAPTTAAPTADAPEIKAPDGMTFGDFKFTVNGKELTNKDFEGIQAYKIKVETVNSKGTASEVTYGGYAIADVLKAAGVEGTKVVATCSDDYETDPIEITAENAPYTLIAIEKDKEMAKDGTVFFAPCLETLSQNYAKKVVGITVS